MRGPTLRFARVATRRTPRGRSLKHKSDHSEIPHWTCLRTCIFRTKIVAGDERVSMPNFPQKQICRHLILVNSSNISLTEFNDELRHALVFYGNTLALIRHSHWQALDCVSFVHGWPGLTCFVCEDTSAFQRSPRIRVKFIVILGLGQ